jgi:hypothetical protein
MTKNLKMKKTLWHLTVAGLLLSSCTKDKVKDSDPISSHFGEYIDGDFNASQGDFAHDFKTTDNGLYMVVSNSQKEADDFIYRYELPTSGSVLEGDWSNYRFNLTSDGDYFSDYAPVYMQSEKFGQKEVFIRPLYHAFDTPVYRTVSMISGNTLKETAAPAHKFSYATGGSYNSFANQIFKNTSGGADWLCFQGETVSDNDLHVIKKRYGNLNPEFACNIKANGEMLYSKGANENLYALSPADKKLFVIKTNNEVKTYNLSNYYDPNYAVYNYKNKFRSSNTGVYFQVQNKVLKLDEGNGVVSLFYTIQANGGGPELGDFCVDNDYLFATDGTRKELAGFNKKINIIPSKPSTSNQEILLDYISKTTSFKTGEMETFTNPNDKYIYILDGLQGKILVISKNYL